MEKNSASVVGDMNNEEVIIFPLKVLFSFAFFHGLKIDFSYTVRS